MSAQLSVNIGANIQGLQTGLQTAGNQVQQFGRTVTTGANQAQQALVNVGRVAQDAPFGFIAIQNNINPLLESFERLRNETGSTGSALRALGSSLLGPAGLGVGISLLTAGLTYLSQHPEALSNAFNSLAGSTDQANQALQQYNDSLAKAEAPAKAEISNLNSLVTIARDESQTRAVRLQAIRKMNQEYPELNKQITMEGINTQKTTELINKLNEAMVIRAKIQAVTGLLGEEFRKQLDAQNNGLVSQASAFSKLKALVLAAAGGQGLLAAQSELFNSGLAEQSESLKKTGQNISAYEKLLTSLNLELAKTGNLADPDKAKGLKKLFELPPIKGIASPFVDAFLSQIASNKDKANQTLVRLFDRAPDLASKILNGQSVDSTVKVPGLDTSGLKAMNERAQAILQGYRGISKELIAQNNLLAQSFQTTFEGIGQAIGDSLANGGNVLDALGQTILASLGGILVEFGKMAIAAGIASTALAHALSEPLNPASGIDAIAAGVALVAIGSAVKGFAGHHGGSSSSPASGGFGSVPSGFSAAPPAGYLTGSGAGQTFIPQTVIKGNDLVITYNRTLALNKRQGI